MNKVIKAAIAAIAIGTGVLSAQEKPNVLVIFSDDVGMWNISAYSHGQMGYQTPNIDRIASEGVLFTDYYGEQSCTAGRAGFITGQYSVRVGLPKVGLVGSPQGLSSEDPTIAEMLKPHGYVTGQFGKNHLGDRNEFLPTVHGFDEFLGNLYHLNTHTEMEDEDYPKSQAFIDKFGPRGVIHSFASDKDDPTEDPRFGKIGRQTVEDTGPLNTERIKTVDEEFLKGAKDFIRKAHNEKKPFFTWFNASRMHFPTILKDGSIGVTGQGIFADGMVEHDGHVGQLLDLLDELGIADNTIVLYTSDNGPMKMNWPDGGTDPYRSEKGTGWEGAFRVPAMIRWPGKLPAGKKINGIASHHDWFPTFYAAITGDADIGEKLKKGHKVDDKTYKVHLDGFNLLPYLKGEAKDSPREFFLYFGDDTSLLNLRYKDWKFTFAEQRAEPGTWDLWRDPFVELRVPRIQNLRRDPFERASVESVQYQMWIQEKQFMLVPVTVGVSQALKSFEEFPPRGLPLNLSMSNALKRLQEGAPR